MVSPSDRSMLKHLVRNSLSVFFLLSPAAHGHISQSARPSNCLSLFLTKNNRIIVIFSGYKYTASRFFFSDVAIEFGSN